MTTIILSTIIFLYGKCYASLFAGLVVHFALKFNSNKELHSVANEKLTFGRFFSDSLSSHVINIACSFLWMLVLPDVIKALPKINGSESYANIAHIAMCFVMGVFNSYIVLYFADRAKKKIMAVIDEKTNTADGK